MSSSESTRLEFSTSLYRLDAIQSAIAAFEACAQFSVMPAATEEEQNFIQIVISDIHPSLEDVLVDTFCNHVLFETIVLERREQGGML